MHDSTGKLGSHALILSASSAMMPLGLIITGPLADRLGVQCWLIAGGVITTLLGVLAFFIPAIIDIEYDQAHQAHSGKVMPGSGILVLVVYPTENFSD